MDMIRRSEDGEFCEEYTMCNRAADDGKRHGAHHRITDVLEVFYLPTETRVNATRILRQSFQIKLRRTVKIAGAETKNNEELSPATSTGVLKNG